MILVPRERAPLQEWFFQMPYLLVKTRCIFRLPGIIARSTSRPMARLVELTQIPPFRCSFLLLRWSLRGTMGGTGSDRRGVGASADPRDVWVLCVWRDFGEDPCPAYIHLVQAIYFDWSLIGTDSTAPQWLGLLPCLSTNLIAFRSYFSDTFFLCNFYLRSLEEECLGVPSSYWNKFLQILVGFDEGL